MLAPASPRPGSSPGEADRRRVLRLVVIAVIAALLAIAVPVALAARSGDTAPAPALTGAGGTGSGASAIAPPAAGSAAAPVENTPAASSAPPSSAPASSAPASSPATSAAALPATAQSDTGAADATSSAPAPADPAPAVAPAPADPTPPAAPPTSAAPANWMEALRPQVDPEGLATWVFQARGAWGASDGHTVYIDPDVPEDKRWSVMVHEYGHVLQVRHYGSLNATAVAMNAIVGAGPTDKGPTESNADCIAELLGATWTDYGCQDALRPAAAALVAQDPAAAALAVRS